MIIDARAAVHTAQQAAHGARRHDEFESGDGKLRPASLAAPLGFGHKA
jgi:hypothetical protein